MTQRATEPLPEYPGKEVEMIVVNYPPGSVDPVHRHNAHAFVYVLDGSIVMGLNGGKTVTLHAGDTFHEGPDDVHTVGRNASRTGPEKFIVFLINDKGVPVPTPVKQRDRDRGPATPGRLPASANATNRVHRHGKRVK